MIVMFLSVIGMIFWGGSVQADLSDGLIAYYPFNGNANDESGNGNNGTINGATLTTDRFGNTNCAYSFDGVNDYIDVGDIDIVDTPISISSWIFVSGKNGEYRAIVAKRGTGGDYNYDLTVNSDDGIYFGWSVGYSQNRIDTSDELDSSTWLHVVAVYSNDGVSAPEIYVNGVDVS